jgi:hypothetical protein
LVLAFSEENIDILNLKKEYMPLRFDEKEEAIERGISARIGTEEVVVEEIRTNDKFSL